MSVKDTHELFSAVETLSHMQPLRSERLMIISNGAAPAALALDELWRRNGALASLSDETLSALQNVLPSHIECGNPLDLRDDASPSHYLQAVSLLLDDQEVDALMIIHSPSAVAPASESDRILIDTLKQHP